MAKDISGVFALPSDAYEEIRKTDPKAADRFWANIQNRRFSRAENHLRQTSSGWNDLAVGRLDPKLHQWGELGAAKPKQIVTTPKARDTYIARIQKRVGFAKGSWINAGKSIGGRVRGAAHNLPTLEGLTPTAFAIVDLLQCVMPFGLASTVSLIMCDLLRGEASSGMKAILPRRFTQASGTFCFTLSTRRWRFMSAALM